MCSVLFSLQEEEFLGFTNRDIKKAEKQFARVTAALAALQDCKPPGTRSSGVRAARKRQRPEDTVTELVKQGLAKRPRESVAKKVFDAEQKKREKDKEKRQKWELKKRASLTKDAGNDELDEDEDGKPAVAKLKSIKIRLGSDGKDAKIVRSRGRPTIYEKSGRLKHREDKRRRTKTKRKDRRGKTHAAEDSEIDTDDDDDDDKVLYSLGDFQEAVSPKRVRRKRSDTPKKRAKTVQKPTVSKAKPVLSSMRRVRTSAVAKQLLTKAKNKGNNLLRKSQVSAKNVVKKPARRRQFVIPSVSSRSARKITPNKRFFDDSFSNVALGQPRVVDLPSYGGASSRGPSVQPQSQSQSLSMPLHVNTDPRLLQRKGLFDLPAIVEGKRERKPSMKLIRKLADEDEPQMLHRRLSEESPQKFQKPGASPDTPITSASFAKQSQSSRARSASSSERRRGDKSSRFRGIKLGNTHSAIVQKAKFRLNQAALNRSKVALAKTLRREMSREEDCKVTGGHSWEKDGGGEGGGNVAGKFAATKHPQFGAVPLSAVPVSPLKIGMKKEPVKFGSSGLPQGTVLYLKHIKQFNHVQTKKCVGIIFFVCYSS